MLVQSGHGDNQTLLSWRWKKKKKKKKERGLTNARDPMRTEQETCLSGLVQCDISAMLANIQGIRTE